MALHATAFRSGDTKFGIFYPTGYVLSVFPDAADADRAVAALLDAGFGSRDIVVATGADVLAYSDEMRANEGLFSRFEHFVSGLYGGEGALADEIVAFAGRGHTFVAVHAPDEAATASAASVVRALEPVVLRKFDSLTFTDLH